MPSTRTVRVQSVLWIEAVCVLYYTPWHKAIKVGGRPTNDT